MVEKTLAEKEQVIDDAFQQCIFYKNHKNVIYTDDVKEHVNRALEKILKERTYIYRGNNFIEDIFKEDFGELVE